MDAETAYNILSEEVKLNRENADEFDYVLRNEDEYRTIVAMKVDAAVAELATEENPVAISQIVRKTFNATHRVIHGKIVNIAGHDLMKPINDIVIEYVRIAEFAQIEEEYVAAAFVACSETCDIAYA